MGGQAFHQGIRPGTLGHGNPAQYDYATIAGYLEQAQPEGLGGVAEAYAMVQKALGETEGNLGKHVQRLNMIWKGGAKELGIADMRMLTEATGTLATASGQFSTAMHSGYTAMKISQHSMPPTSTPLGTLPSTNPAEAMATKLADDKAAQQHLAKTNTALTSAFDQIPSSVSLALPKSARIEGKFGGTATPSAPPPSKSPSGASSGGLPQQGGAVESPGGPADASKPATSVSGNLNSPLPSKGSLGAQPASGGGSGHSVLAGAQPDLHHVPGGQLESPTTGPVNGPGRPAGSPNVPFGPTGPGLPRQTGGGYRPGAVTLPDEGKAGAGLPRTAFSGQEDAMPGQAVPGALRAGGVLGRGGVNGERFVGGAGGVLRGVGGDARLPAGGVLKSGTVMPQAMGEPSSPFSRKGPGVSATGVPLGSAGGSGRDGEQTREVQFVRENDLWSDEMEVAPRVIGGNE